jgi:hypothetical protein
VATPRLDRDFVANPTESDRPDEEHKSIISRFESSFPDKPPILAPGKGSIALLSLGGLILVGYALSLVSVG